MKVLVVAPKICSPWSEGRKKFVRDFLLQAMERWSVHALITIDEGESTEIAAPYDVIEVSSGWEHIALMRRDLSACIDQVQPDLVCHFPFGAFSGVRGIANLWIINSVENLCRKKQVVCCTLMYSLTSEANRFFHNFFLRDVYFNQYIKSDRNVRFGVRLPATNAINKNKNKKCLLFMAGMAEETCERLNYVLDVRGLRFLLKAGAQLQNLGFSLIVGVPLLKNEKLLAILKEDSDNTWVENNIDYLSVVSVPDIYENIGAFVFPYAQEEFQFVPTSIVEAMHYGVPVFLPNLKFLSPFYDGKEKSLVYKNNDIVSFITQINRFTSEDGLSEKLQIEAKKFIDKEYDINNTLIDVEDIYEKLSSSL